MNEGWGFMSKERHLDAVRWQLRSRRTLPRSIAFYNDLMVRDAIVMTAVLGMAATALAQTPQPFPRPGTPSTTPNRPAAPPAAPPAPAPAPAQVVPADTNSPTDASLGFPIYPTAQFIASYDAGRGQRYYVFGTSTPFADLVTYYRTQLKERGDQVFDQPPTHMFEVGRFREESMAFPPGVTVKDWTWGGSQGYPNPRADAQPARFPTIIMIVPAPPTAANPR